MTGRRLTPIMEIPAPGVCRPCWRPSRASGQDAFMGSYRRRTRRASPTRAPSGARPPAGIDWHRPPTAVLDDGHPPFSRWFPDGVLNTCFNALDRHVPAGRGDQAGAGLRQSRSPAPCARCTYARAAATRSPAFAGALQALGVGQGRPRRRLHADGARGRRRHARLRAARRRALGRLRRVRRERARRAHRRRAARRSIVTASCGIEPTRVVQYKPMLDAAMAAADAPSPTTASSCSARRPRRS